MQLYEFVRDGVVLDTQGCYLLMNPSLVLYE